MFRTPLCDQLVNEGATLGEYAGAETAVSFGSPDREFDALRSSCAVYDLGWRAKLVLTGGDRVRWLNGMVTNNVRDLGLNRAVYSFLLNPQGRIQGDLYVYNRGEYLLCDTEMSQVEMIKQVFDRYIIMDDVEVTDISSKLTAIAVHGPRAAEVLRGAGVGGLDAEPMELNDLEWRGAGISVTRMASPEFLTFELWASPATIVALWQAVREAGAVAVGTEALETFRIAAGVPKYGQDIRERDLPQETRQDYALSFNKGCYIGQEIVERIRARGQVHRQFGGFVIEGAQPAPGTKLQLDGKDAGEITSVHRIGGRLLALGYVRREAGTAGTELAFEGGKAIVSDIPFPESRAGSASVKDSSAVMSE